MARVFVGLGTNLGDRPGNLRRALELMEAEGIRVQERSSVRETDPVENTDQPRFLNQVVMARTVLLPGELLKTLLGIEQAMGRVRDSFKGPRIIDLDILLYDDLVLDSPDLAIPHPAITRRAFVMEHLLEIDARLADPRTGTMYAQILASIVK